jgi:hypothetical protein
MFWRENFRQDYLELYLSLDGRGRLWPSRCPGCKPEEAQEALFRCLDCYGHHGYCKECILSRHVDSPLHRLQESKPCCSSTSLTLSQTWVTDRFVPISLKTLGARYQLGHQSGKACPAVHREEKNFFVITANFIHSVHVKFCDCIDRVPYHEQLLEIGWWPATPENPSTAVTIEALKLFQAMNLHGNLPPSDFYRALEAISDPEGLGTVDGGEIPVGIHSIKAQY